MLALPYAKSDKKFDTSSLSTFFSLHYSSSAYKVDLTKLESLKNSIIHLDSSDDITITNHIYLYYELNSLYSRIKAYESELSFSFTYFDPLNVKTNKITSTSLKFELAATLYNLAAAFSMKGSSHERQTDEGLKATNKFFQYSLFCVDKLSELNTSDGFPIKRIPGETNLNNNLSCFTTEGINFLKSLLMAQIQACVYEKASRDCTSNSGSSMRASVVSKIAIQTYNFYVNLSKAIHTGCMNSALDNTWITACEIQIKLYQGLSEYWLAVVANEAASARGNGYGEGVTRAAKAENLLKQALSLTRNSTILAPHIKNNLDMVSIFHKKALYDINHIYMESPADESQLKFPDGISLAKSSPFPGPPFSSSSMDVTSTTSFSPSLFLFIIPKDIIDEATKYNSFSKTTFETYNTRNGDVSSIARLYLQEMNLPDTVDAVKFTQLMVKNNGDPESISNMEKSIPQWKDILDLRSSSSNDPAGFYGRLLNQLEDLDCTSQRALNTMANIETSITREERIDEDFHHRYPFFYNIASSNKTQEIISTLQKFRESFGQAQSSDFALRTTLLNDETCLKMFQFLSTGSFQQYLQYFSMTDLPSGESISIPEADILELKLNSLNQNLTERHNCVEELRTLSTFDGFQEINNNPICVPTLVDTLKEKASKIEEITARIEKLIHEQETLLSEISTLNQQFIAKKDNSILIKHFNKVMSNISAYITKAKNSITQISAGFTFYANFQKKITTLQQKVDDMILTQQQKRHEYELTINDPKVTKSHSYSPPPSGSSYAPLNATPYANHSIPPMPPSNPSYAPSNPSYAPSNPSYAPSNPSYDTPSQNNYQHNPSAYGMPSNDTYAGNISSNPSYNPSYNYDNYGNTSAPIPPPRSYHQTPHDSYHQTPHDSYQKDQMVQNLVDMGFQKDRVIDTLTKCQWRTDDALNRLLSENAPNVNSNPPPQAYPIPEKKKSSVFSMFGSKKK